MRSPNHRLKTRCPVTIWLSFVAFLAPGCDSDVISGKPELDVDATSLQFPDVAVGYPQTRSLVITNIGRAGLVFEKIELETGASQGFSILGRIDPTSGQIAEPLGSLGPGQSMELVLQYDPAAEDSADFDLLRLQTNDSDDCPSQYNPCEIQLSGNGAPPDAELEVLCQQDEDCPGTGDVAVCKPILDANNTHPVRVAFNFCEVATGQSRQLDAMLKNAGNIPLEMNGFAFDGGIGDASDFRLLRPERENLTLQPGEEEWLTVVYAPNSEGADNTGMDIDTNDDDLPGGVFGVRLLAFCAEPDIDVHPLHIPFSGVAQGSSDTQTINIHNTGSGTLAIGGLEVAGGTVNGEFSLSKQAPLELGPGQQTTLDVTYHPQDGGHDDGSVIITSNDPDESTVVVSLGAEVRPDLDVSPPEAVTFIDVPAGGSAQLPFELRNVGYADLTVDDIAFSANPGDPAVFGLDGLPAGFPTQPLVLSPGESIELMVTFTDSPSMIDEVGQLDISHNSPNDSNPYHLLVLSTGTPANLPPVAVIDPPSLTVTGKDPVSLDAGDSYDPDQGDSVTTYAWSFLFTPSDAQGNHSQAALSSTTGVTTSFTPDQNGTYIVRLVVYDSFNVMSLPVDAEISVNP